MLETMQSSRENETIDHLGIRRSNNYINIQSSPNAKILEFDNERKIYIMKYDLCVKAVPDVSGVLVFDSRTISMPKQLSLHSSETSNVKSIAKKAQEDHVVRTMLLNRITAQDCL